MKYCQYIRLPETLRFVSVIRMSQADAMDAQPGKFVLEILDSFRPKIHIISGVNGFKLKSQ